MKKIIAILILLPIFLTGCLKISATNKGNGDIISAALSGFMSVDISLNNNIKYFSVDLSAIKNIKEEDKNIITEQLKKGTSIDVKYDSLSTLESNGLFNRDKKYLEGLLLTVSDVKKINTNKYSVTGSKFRMGDTPTPILCTIEYINGSWKIVNTEILKIDPTKS